MFALMPPSRGGLYPPRGWKQLARTYGARHACVMAGFPASWKEIIICRTKTPNPSSKRYTPRFVRWRSKQGICLLRGWKWHVGFDRLKGQKPVAALKEDAILNGEGLAPIDRVMAGALEAVLLNCREVVNDGSGDVLAVAPFVERRRGRSAVRAHEGGRLKGSRRGQWRV